MALTANGAISSDTIQPPLVDKVSLSRNVVVIRQNCPFCSNFLVVYRRFEDAKSASLSPHTNVLIPTNDPQRRLQPHEIYRIDPYLRIELLGPHFARNWSGSVPENSADYA